MSAAAKLGLRPVRAADDAFLRELDASIRMPMFAGFDDRLRSTLLDQQYVAARRSRAQRTPPAREEIVLLDGSAVGLLATAREPGLLHLVDIALVPAVRSRGIGSALIARLFELADAERLAVRAYVYRDNPRAHALYLRMGFAEVAGDEIGIALERRPRG